MMLISLATIIALGTTSSDFPNPKRAEADLAAGTPVYVRSSGVVGPGPLSPRYDSEFGLPIEDTGCKAFRDEEYNLIVRKWVGANGLPKNSMKPRFVTLEDAENALRGATLVTGKAPKAVAGWTVTLAADHLSITAKGADKPAGQLWAVLPSARVAIRGTSAFIQVVDGAESPILHIDLEKGAFLQKLLPKRK